MAVIIWYFRKIRKDICKLINFSLVTLFNLFINFFNRIMMNDHCKHHEEHYHHHDDHHHHHDDHHHDDHHHHRRNDLSRSGTKNHITKTLKSLEKFNEKEDSNKIQMLKNAITSRKSKRRSSNRNHRHRSSSGSGKRTLDNAQVSFDKQTNTTHYYWPKKKRTIFPRRRT